jgi:hypothetical protein
MEMPVAYEIQRIWAAQPIPTATSICQYASKWQLSNVAEINQTTMIS